MRTPWRGFLAGFRVFNKYDEVIEIHARARVIDSYYVPDEFKTRAEYAQWLLAKYPNLTLYVYDIPESDNPIFHFDKEEYGCESCGKRVIRMCPIPTVSMDGRWHDDYPDVRVHDWYDHNE